MFFHAATGRRGSKTAACCFSKAGRKGIADISHGDDAFINGNAGADAGKGNIGRGESDDNAAGVTLYSGNFHKAGDRVADKAELVGDGNGTGVSTL